MPDARSHRFEAGAAQEVEDFHGDERGELRDAGHAARIRGHRAGHVRAMEMVVHVREVTRHLRLDRNVHDRARRLRDEAGEGRWRGVVDETGELPIVVVDACVEDADAHRRAAHHAGAPDRLRLHDARSPLPPIGVESGVPRIRRQPHAVRSFHRRTDAKIREPVEQAIEARLVDQVIRV